MKKKNIFIIKFMAFMIFLTKNFMIKMLLSILTMIRLKLNQVQFFRYKSQLPTHMKFNEVAFVTFKSL